MKSIVVIGGGSIGKRHVRNLFSLGEKDITLVEIDKERRGVLAKEFGVPVAASSAEAMMAKKFDIAFICSPSRFHMEQARFAAENGCHLFIEKPLADTVVGIDDLVQVVQKKQLVTFVGSNWKFYPLFQRMKDMLDAGVIGKVLSARCQFGQYLPDWHPWEDHRRGYSANKALGGGVLLDAHEFDYLTWFMGPVKKLVCFADRVSTVTVDTEDVAAVTLRFASGALGEIHLDYLQRFYQRDFEFFGEQGTITWRAEAKNILLKVKGKDDEIIPLSETYDMNDMYVEEVRHFLRCVEERRQTVTPIETGAEIVRLISAAKESAEKETIISF